MERGGGSGERSRVRAKTSRTSSGCLRSKETSDGVGRTVCSTGTGPNLQKKRSRLIVSDSESSDVEKPPHRRGDREGSPDETFAPKRNGVKREYVKRNSEASGSLMEMNKLDVFEFDEYDGFDRNLNRKRLDNGSVGVSGRSSLSSRRVDSSLGGSGSGRNGLAVRRKKPYVNGASSMSSQEESSSESDSDESIRVQGRNGVLKVKVNNKPGTLATSANQQESDKCRRPPFSSKVQKRDRLSSGSDSDGPVRVQGRNGVLKVKVNNKPSTLATSTNHQETEIYERTPSSSKVQKRESVVGKKTFRRSNNVDFNSESEESDMSRKLKRRKSENSKPKAKINYRSKPTFSEPLKPDLREERRGKRGGGTEKQKLRERIRGMLTDAGWTIDYRPRRNQSYLDAVYVNPSGTAYWSIIKAYDALLQQLKDEEIDARPRKVAAVVASVSEDVVNNLARKAKNTWIEKTKKWKDVSSGSDSDGDDEGEDIDTPGKSTKKRINGTDWDDFHTKSKRYYNDARPCAGTGLHSHHLHGRKSKKIGRCTLLVRNSKEKKNPVIDGFNPYSGKKTLLSWLIDSGVVKLRQKVQYMNRQCTTAMLEGWITREGIHCVCCSKILTLSRFEIHAGSKSCQPFENIYLESGTSLLQCQAKAWNMQTDATNLGFHQVDTDGDDPNDDACGICGDGGDLICCDSCPSTYHQTCLGMQVLPPGDWHCPNCTCKFCDAVVDSGGEDRNLLSLLSCNMCERRYHQSCMTEVEAHKVQSLGLASRFCGPTCFELFEKLQKYLGVENELEGGYSWSLIHRVDIDSDKDSQLSAQRIVNNSKLAVGLAIMDECFLPIVDRRSGVNLIRNVLYNSGSNFSRINFTGFYTAILERGDEIISAASLRFHGMQLAEMPFIGTRHIYRRQGMCRRLFDAIESAMRSLSIEKLVIPAIPDFLHAWTGNFRFTPLDDSVRKEMRSLNTLVFPGIDVLQKPLLREENVITPAAASDFVALHEDAIESEIETVKKTVFPFDEPVADAADSDKYILASNEQHIPVSVETATVTISKPDDKFRKCSPGEDCIGNSITLKHDTKRCEDRRSLREDVPIDTNVEEADASLAAKETHQATADYKACANYLVESKLSSSISGRGSSDISSISQEAKCEQSSLNGICN